MDEASLCVFGILAGCGVNVVFLEMITSRDKGAGALITFAQFLFVSLFGMSQHLLAGKRKIPLVYHLLITLTFFSVSLLNNMALSYNISMPLHMVFRSSSLAASLFLGSLVFGKSYGREQIYGVLLVTFGIFLTTAADANVKSNGWFWKQPMNTCCDGDPVEDDVVVRNLGSPESVVEEYRRWLVGLAMLSFALFASAGLGHLQEWIYSKFGKHSGELKFYSHFFALPLFIIFRGKEIADSAGAWNHSPGLGFQRCPEFLDRLFGEIPLLWLLLVGNVFSQLLCISCVYRLTAVSSTLTCTMTITLRKFLSILFSVLYFQNPFSNAHWTGTCLVFAGALLYSGAFANAAKRKQD